ncbi:NAD-dependent epimerase/dehydratase family protein [Paenibacillus sp. B01]|uniref:NAD-dependent epimerase/dehydratase family protein n=1 Tax=Paenibacillus sp. B01 TaxID=2660554 RepID=UPI00129BF19A|nr:NAD(P)-dependent oxidoreductase [Paenibacillus sp. B01]QGG55659.1 NAD-dependent epimerase/dehydratase family protein [Paenibacillus sp. B01]
MNTIAVTGGSGKLGTEAVRQLLEAGYDVFSIDSRVSERLPCRQLQVDLADLGQVASALRGADAILHLAAIPAPVGFAHSHIFTNNVVGGFNILEAASLLGIRRVVLGSSTSCYGFAWAERPFSPSYLPVDEEHPQLAQEGYGLSKTLNELTAAMFSRRSGLETVCLRFSLIAAPQEYAHLREAMRRPETFAKILWSYVDLRDAAAACRLALEADEIGAEVLNITGDDALSERDTRDLVKAYFPDVSSFKRQLSEGEPLFDNRRAKRVLGWTPKFGWRE